MSDFFYFLLLRMCFTETRVLIIITSFTVFMQALIASSGVAVGSSIGHAIGGMFGGGSSSTEQQPQDNNLATQGNESSTWGTQSCDSQAKTFTKCLDENQGNMQICGWYLDQLVSIFINVHEDEKMLSLSTESLPGSCQSILRR